MAKKKVGEYTLIERVGKGGQATVWKARDDKGGLVAIKKMSVGSNEDNTKSYEREVAIMKLVTHPYMIKSLASFKDEDKFYLAYEYCPIDLLSFLKKQPGSKIPENVAKRWIFQLIDVMAFLNKHRIIHRDLKPDNILLTSENENAEIRLADFGLARQGLTARSFVGTLEYASPEIKNSELYSYNTDVWSLGVIYYALVFGRFPIFTSRKLEYPPNITNVTEEAKRFIEICLVFDQNTRPNFEDLFRNDYFNEIIEERKDNPADDNEEEKMNEIMNHANRLSIRPEAIIEDRSDHPQIIANPSQDPEKVIFDLNEEIVRAPEPSLRFPDNRRDIENLVLKVFFLGCDVMNYVEQYRNENEFLVFFTAEYFTNQFKFILENLMQSQFCYEFGDGFFEQFFSKSERITNVCNQLEPNYKNYTNDQYLAASWQIVEIILSERTSAPEYILTVLQEISQKLNGRTQSN